MFSVYHFAADPDRLRDVFRHDEQLVPEIVRRMERRGEYSQEEIERLCARVNEGRFGRWPAVAEPLAVNAFLWMLDSAAEPITFGRLRDIRDVDYVDATPFLKEMLADPGPIPVPEVSEINSEIGFLEPMELRELAAQKLPVFDDRHLEAVATELVEVFESLSEDDLGLYSVLEGAKIARH